MENNNTAAPAGDDLANLLKEVKAAEAGAQPGQPGEPGQPGQDAQPGPESVNVREFKFCFDMIKAFPPVRKRLPNFHAAMTEPEMKESAEAMGAVFDKYGLSLSGLFEKYAAEIRALMVFGAWTYTLAGALIVDLDTMKAAKAAREAEDKKKAGAASGSQ